MCLNIVSCSKVGMLNIYIPSVFLLFVDNNFLFSHSLLEEIHETPVFFKKLVGMSDTGQLNCKECTLKSKDISSPHFVIFV